jgi:hypothetical protein
LTWAPQPEVVTYLIALRRVGSDEFEPFRYVAGSEMGQVVLRGLDPQAHYAISLAAVDGNGRLSYFSSELLVGSNP